MTSGLIVDLFADGGGASTGLMWALGRSPDIAINHDPEALVMHAANHPNTHHLLNDITRVLPLEATQGRPVDVLHASPDCCHFSKAKGGKPRSQYIRDLAWVVVRWAEDTHPTLITLENREKPLSKTAQVRMCGNSVPPQLIAAVVKANGPATWAEKPKTVLPLMTLIAPEWRIAKAVNA